MVLYRSLSDFPDRIASGLETELRSDETLVAGIPEAGENFFAKYATYYILTSERFISCQKAPLGATSMDVMSLDAISRVEVAVSGIRIKMTIHAPGYDEGYKLQDGKRTGDAEQFARMVREHAIE